MLSDNTVDFTSVKSTVLFPLGKWQICYYHYGVWRSAPDGEESVFDRVMRELVEKERSINDRDQQTTMIIVDSKSIKNTDTAQEKSFDSGKKLQVLNFI